MNDLGSFYLGIAIGAVVSLAGIVTGYRLADRRSVRRPQLQLPRSEGTVVQFVARNRKPQMGAYAVVRDRPPPRNP